MGKKKYVLKKPVKKNYYSEVQPNKVVSTKNKKKKSDNRPKTNIKLFKHEASESPLRSHGIILGYHFSLCIYSSKNILTTMLSLYIHFFLFQIIVSA